MTDSVVAMVRAAKCLLEGHQLTRTPSGGIALEMDISVWESSILPEGHTLRMRFVLSPDEASELGTELSEIAGAPAPD